MPLDDVAITQADRTQECSPLQESFEFGPDYLSMMAHDNGAPDRPPRARVKRGQRAKNGGLSTVIPADTEREYRLCDVTQQEGQV